MRKPSPSMIHAVGTLGEDFQTMRLMRGWTQHDMAMKLGVSVSTVKNIEKGSLGVAIGVYAQAFALFKKLDVLTNALDPLKDPLYARTLLQQRKRARTPKLARQNSMADASNPDDGQN